MFVFNYNRPHQTDYTGPHGVIGVNGSKTAEIYALNIKAADAASLPFLGLGVVPIDESYRTYFWDGDAYTIAGTGSGSTVPQATAVISADGILWGSAGDPGFIVGICCITAGTLAIKNGSSGGDPTIFTTGAVSPGPVDVGAGIDCTNGGYGDITGGSFVVFYTLPE